jgi:hypothetical protein
VIPTAAVMSISAAPLSPSAFVQLDASSTPAHTQEQPL